MLMIIPLVIGAFMYGKKVNENEVIEDIEIEYLNDYKFIDELDVKEICLNQDVLLKKTKLKELDLEKFEKAINKNVWAKNVEVFLTSNNILKIQLEQKKPIARILLNDSSSSSYYIDEQGKPFPVSLKYRPKIPLITGNKIGVDKKGVLLHQQLKKLSIYIQEDSFWNNMITQINLRENNDIELITSIGSATVLFGDANKIEDKFSRLFQFYKYKFYEVDWAAIKEIDVRFNRQVVCRRDGTAPDFNYFKTADSTSLNKINIVSSNTNVVKSNSLTANVIKPNIIKTNVVNSNVISKPLIKSDVKKENIKPKSSVLPKKNLPIEKVNDIKIKNEKLTIDVKKEKSIVKKEVTKEDKKEKPKEINIEVKQDVIKKNKPIIISSEPTKN